MVSEREGFGKSEQQRERELQSGMRMDLCEDCSKDFYQYPCEEKLLTKKWVLVD